MTTGRSAPTRIFRCGDALTPLAATAREEQLQKQLVLRGVLGRSSVEIVAQPAPGLLEFDEALKDTEERVQVPIELSIGLSTVHGSASRSGTPEDPLLMTICGHGFCRGCIERVLMTTKSLNPTCAPCPVCRRELSLFDLQLPSGTKLHEKDTACAALAGKVFVQMRTVGLASYHFPITAADTGDEGSNAKLPYLCYESARVDEFGWTLDNGARPPPRTRRWVGARR